MRFESSITAITWLPFAALDAMPNLPLGLAVAHYDEPPPDVLGDLELLRDADRFREANELRAWIDVEDGKIVAYGRDGRSLVGGSGLDLGADQIVFPTVEFPAIRPEPEVGADSVRFVQTVGGRIGLPVPRPLSGKPYLHVGSATAWTTLELVLRADGSSAGRLVTGSPFPRHSIYGADRRLRDEHGLTDYAAWYEESLDDSPWAAEDALDAELDQVALSSGASFTRRRLDPGETLVEQDEAGNEMFLLLAGALAVEIGGEVLAHVGAGAVLGERALLGDGRRTATLRAVKPSRLAILVPTRRLAELALARQR